VKAAVEQHGEALEALAEALLDRETLEGQEALALLQQHGVTPEESPHRRAEDPPVRPSWRTGTARH